jgi:DNA-binding response OmpR family regulator
LKLHDIQEVSGVSENTRQRILVVDDDEHIQKSLAQYLEMEDFDVDVASSGQEALEQAGRQTPDLVLLDIMMPEMDGFEVVERLRQEAPTARVPVILLTARGQDTDVIKGYQMGVSSYLTKPFNLDELVDTIREVLEADGSQS